MSFQNTGSFKYVFAKKSINYTAVVAFSLWCWIDDMINYISEIFKI